MHVIAVKHLKEAAGQFRDAAKPLAAWRTIAKEAHWHNPEEIRENFADVDFAGDDVIFRIHESRYRLVTTVHYAREKDGSNGEGHVWVRSFLPQKQYENGANGSKGDIR